MRKCDGSVFGARWWEGRTAAEHVDPDLPAFTRVACAVVALLLLASPLWSKEDEKAKNARPAATAFEKTVDELFAQRYPQKLEEYFCSLGTNPDLGFRWAGTSADIAAGRRIQREMEAMGLKNVRREPVPVDVFEFKKAGLIVGEREISASTFAGVLPTPRNGITAPVVYVDRGTAADFEAAGDVAGKLVLIDVVKLEELLWNVPAFEAEFRGAAGIIFTTNPENPADNWRNEKSLGAVDSCFALSTPPMVFISQHDSGWLQSHIKRGSVEVTMLLDEEVKLSRDGGVGYNVLGELPGSSADGQMILLMAHYDAHFQGAQDNTGSVVMMLTLAKAMCDSGYRPQHKIVFMGVAAEEFGRVNSNYDWAIGSYWAISHTHRDWAERVRLAINLEHMTESRVPFTMCFNSELRPWLEQLSESHSQLLPRGTTQIIPANFYTDQGPFIACGVPCVTFLGSCSDESDEFDQQLLHSQFDTQDRIDWRYFADICRFVHAAVGEVDSGVLPYDFAPRANELAAQVKQEQLLTAGASPSVVSKLVDAVSSFERAATGFQAKRGSLLEGHVHDVNTRLLKVANVVNSGLTALSPTQDIPTIYPHEYVLANALNMKAAIEALRNPTPDAAAALKALERIYPTHLGTLFSSAVYRRLLERCHPDSDSLNWAALCKLPVPPDVMPEYRAIERGDISHAVSSLETKHGAVVIELNKRLEDMVSVLHDVHALMQPLL